MPPVFKQTGQSRPVTFHFYTTKESEKDFRYGWGWMIATINDRTGELIISSDWGHWAHRWHVDALGSSPWNRHATSSLMEFIGHYATYSDKYRFEYLAGKLSTPEEKREFDPEKTVASLRQQIIDLRKDEQLTRSAARELWDELGDLEHERDMREFVDGVYRIDRDLLKPLGFDPCEDLHTSPSTKYEVLVSAVLPAVCEAAWEYAVAQRPKTPPLGWSADAEAQCPLWEGLKVRKVMYA